MVCIYKLIFDLAIYYALTGFYLNAIFDMPLFYIGAAALCGLVVTYRLLPNGRLKNLFFFLPGFALIAWPGWLAAVHFAIVWAYSVYCLHKERFYTDYAHFRERFASATLVLLAILPGLILSKNGGRAMLCTLPYISMAFIVGVCCLRTARDEKRRDGIQAVIVLLVTIACAVGTALGIPQVLFGWFRDYIWKLLMDCLLVVGFLVAYGVITVLEWIVMNGASPTKDNISGSEGETAAEIIGIEEGFLIHNGDVLWLRITGYVVCILLILSAIGLLLYWLISVLSADTQAQSSVWREKKETIGFAINRRKRIRKKSQDPRLAIRYYYGCFLDECQKRKVGLQPCMTCREICTESSAHFLEEDMTALSLLYEQARYCGSSEMAAGQAKKAGKLFAKLKKQKLTRDDPNLDL